MAIKISVPYNCWSPMDGEYVSATFTKNLTIGEAEGIIRSLQSQIEPERLLLEKEKQDKIAALERELKQLKG